MCSFGVKERLGHPSTGSDSRLPEPVVREPVLRHKWRRTAHLSHAVQVSLAWGQATGHKAVVKATHGLLSSRSAFFAPCSSLSSWETRVTRGQFWESLQNATLLFLFSRTHRLSPRKLAKQNAAAQNRLGARRCLWVQVENARMLRAKFTELQEVACFLVSRPTRPRFFFFFFFVSPPLFLFFPFSFSFLFFFFSFVCHCCFYFFFFLS